MHTQVNAVLENLIRDIQSAITTELTDNVDYNNIDQDYSFIYQAYEEEIRKLHNKTYYLYLKDKMSDEEIYVSNFINAKVGTFESIQVSNMENIDFTPLFYFIKLVMTMLNILSFHYIPLSELSDTLLLNMLLKMNLLNFNLLTILFTKLNALISSAVILFINSENLVSLLLNFIIKFNDDKALNLISSILSFISLLISRFKLTLVFAEPQDTSQTSNNQTLVIRDTDMNDICFFNMQVISKDANINLINTLSSLILLVIKRSITEVDAYATNFLSTILSYCFKALMIFLDTQPIQLLNTSIISIIDSIVQLLMSQSTLGMSPTLNSSVTDKKYIAFHHDSKQLYMTKHAITQFVEIYNAVLPLYYQYVTTCKESLDNDSLTSSIPISLSQVISYADITKNDYIFKCIHDSAIIVYLLSIIKFYTLFTSSSFFKLVFPWLSCLRLLLERTPFGLVFIHPFDLKLNTYYTFNDSYDHLYLISHLFFIIVNCNESISTCKTNEHLIMHQEFLIDTSQLFSFGLITCYISNSALVLIHFINELCSHLMSLQHIKKAFCFILKILTNSITDQHHFNFTLLSQPVYYSVSGLIWNDIRYLYMYFRSNTINTNTLQDIMNSYIENPLSKVKGVESKFDLHMWIVNYMRQLRTSFKNKIDSQLKTYTPSKQAINAYISNSSLDLSIIPNTWYDTSTKLFIQFYTNGSYSQLNSYFTACLMIYQNRLFLQHLVEYCNYSTKSKIDNSINQFDISKPLLNRFQDNTSFKCTKMSITNDVFKFHVSNVFTLYSYCIYLKFSSKCVLNRSNHTVHELSNSMHNQYDSLFNSADLLQSIHSSTNGYIAVVPYMDNAHTSDKSNNLLVTNTYNELENYWNHSIIKENDLFFFYISVDDISINAFRHIISRLKHKVKLLNTAFITTAPKYKLRRKFIELSIKHILPQLITIFNTIIQDLEVSGPIDDVIVSIKAVLDKYVPLDTVHSTKYKYMLHTGNIILVVTAISALKSLPESINCV